MLDATNVSMMKKPYKSPLTPANRKALRELLDYQSRSGVSPSRRELASVLQISTTGAQKRLLELQKAGLVRQAVGQHRGIVVNEQRVREELFVENVVAALRGTPCELSSQFSELLHAELAGFRMKL